MKYITLFILSFCFSVATGQQKELTRAQKGELQEAKILIEYDDYKGAYRILRNLNRYGYTIPEVNFYLGQCYLNLPDSIELSLDPLKFAIENNIEEAKFYYAKALHKSELFEEAITFYQEYLAFEGREISDDMINQLIIQSQSAIELINNPVHVQIDNVGGNINTEYPEYVPIISADGTHMYFTSRRPKGMNPDPDDNGKYS